jgi:hypothetical protein
LRLYIKAQRQQQARTPDVRALLLYVSLIALTLCLILSIPYAHADDEGASLSETSGPELISLGDAESGISSDELSENRAKAMLEIDKVFINDQELNGSVSGNSAVNTYSGDNIISGEAFGNASGFVNTIQNTGNNVLIQSATIVNVSIED